MWSAPMIPAPTTATRRGSLVMLIPFGPLRVSPGVPAGVQPKMCSRVRRAIGSGRSMSVPYMSCSTMAKIDGSIALTASMIGANGGLPRRRLRHHAARDRGGERHVVLEGLGEDVAVDLLEVEVADALRVRPDETERITEVVREVAGVEAQVRVARVGLGEEPLDLALRPDVAVGVGVELLTHPELLEQRLAEPVVPAASRAHCSSSSVRDSRTSSVASLRHRSGMTTRCSAPTAVASPATASAWSHARCHWSPPLCKPVKTVPADSLSPREPSSSCSWWGSVGR